MERKETNERKERKILYSENLVASILDISSDFFIVSFDKFKLFSSIVMALG